MIPIDDPPAIRYWKLRCKRAERIAFSASAVMIFQWLLILAIVMGGE